MENNKASSSSSVHHGAGSYYERVAAQFLEEERRIKLEVLIVALVWLVGCPILAVTTSSAGRSSEIVDKTLYGTGDEVMCNLKAFSISASMTGRYPKVWGSIFAPLFAILVIQRSSGALCSLLKLGVLARFSKTNSTVATSTKKTTTSTQKNIDHQAISLWHRIESIEYLGYLAGCCLVVLVILDSRDFVISHVLISSSAFGLL